MRLLVRRGDGTWHPPLSSGYDNEASLQEIIAANPSLIPGVTDSAVACCEFQSGVGPADVVILDADGSLTIVECKLLANSQIRREVTGQVLDYASRVWQMGVEEFEATWMRADSGGSPFEALGDDGTAREALAANLAEPRFNLVLAVDTIHDDLRRIVEYLNAITRPSTGVMAVEFTRLYEDGLEILLPTVYGAELVDSKTDGPPSLSRRRWTLSEFLRWCQENDPDGGSKASRLVAALQDRGLTPRGTQDRTPSVAFALEIPELGPKRPVIFYTHERKGSMVEVRVNDFRDYLDIASNLARKLCAIPGYPHTEDEFIAVGYRKRPVVAVSRFSDQGIDDLAEVIATIGRPDVN